jgi:hypothetical protein
MQRGATILWAAVLVVALTACAPAPGAGTSTAAPEPEAKRVAPVDTAGVPVPVAGTTMPGGPSVAEPRRIEFPPGGTSATQTGTLPSGGIARYVLRAQAGQVMTATVTSGVPPVVLGITGADGVVLLPVSSFSQTWTGTLPTTQDYYLDLNAPTESVSQYELAVTIAPLGPPSSVEQPTPAPTRVQFPPGGISTTVTGSLAPSGRASYVLGIQAGQTLTAEVTASQGEAALIVYGGDGTVLQSPMGGLPSFSGVVPTTQDYILEVMGGPDSPTVYQLVVTIPPLGAATATP